MRKFMNKLILAACIAYLACADLFAQEYKIITTVESIVPMGIGRSRLVENQETVDYRKFTTDRKEGKDSDQGKIDRSEAKIDRMEETKLLNFYSGVGINFQNIASNDAIIGSKLTEMSKDGWVLVFVTSGVESDAGGNDGKGIFITRYIFKK
ncbi:MAG: hypothetical protein DWQ44_06160 [Bacteroidetes bacterium]|nr:MAG: hypothetical protein DWQ33_13090 [Bacteroidota bacterium]REK03554.1 MAG: hypothetical protein DWQ39_09360 [Bacteroidota bacterium]REK34620.1 MAG: hypothetical protein DWQ44_06160 [Bacteroidota bacterium]REK50682.1 MAG: hypothetical protein DWQ48_03510 [Bacteroidota bacterium]